MILLRLINCKSKLCVPNQAKNICLSSKSICLTNTQNLLYSTKSFDRSWLLLSSRNLSTKDGEILDPNKPDKNSNRNWKNEDFKRNSSSYKKFLGVFSGGIIAYFGISHYLESIQKNNAHNISINYNSKHLPGKIKPSKSIDLGPNPNNLKLTLYQYASCPFCCKVRAYLDYYGFSYDIVEVNSISQRQLDWSSYKKVPIIAIQIPSKDNPNVYEDEILQFNDSSLIISALETYRLDPSTSIKVIKTYYEPLKMADNSLENEYSNKYFVMIHNSNVVQSKGSSITDIKYEREWRKWTDSVFIHAISPNVYRTISESIQAFNWFSEFGDWEKNFNALERNIIIYLGAFVMYFIGMRLKSRYSIKDDVRQSLYDYCNTWTSILTKDKPFCGGKSPNLGDLALYGSLTSFQGCQTFDDMFKNNSNMKYWFEAMKDLVTNHRGKINLNSQTAKKA